MFGAIAEHYDLMNRVMTLGQDQRWRRQAVSAAQVGPGSRALDVATGTGDLAFQLAETVGAGGEVVGVDVVPEMLSLARRKAGSEGINNVTFQLADALRVPFPDRSFDAVTCGFGVRNFDDYLEALREMARVVKPGGRVVILEMTPPRNELARAYMHHVVPVIGQILAHARDAYTYLPDSAEAFPQPEEFGRLMQESGLRKVTYRLLNFGTVALHWGTRAESSGIPR